MKIYGQQIGGRITPRYDKNPYIKEAASSPEMMQFWCETPRGGYCQSCSQMVLKLTNEAKVECTGYYMRSRFFNDHTNNCRKKMSTVSDDKSCENFKDFANRVEYDRATKTFTFTEIVSKKETKKKDAPLEFEEVATTYVDDDKKCPLNGGGMSTHGRLYTCACEKQS